LALGCGKVTARKNDKSVLATLYKNSIAFIHPIEFSFYILFPCYAWLYLAILSKTHSDSVQVDTEFDNNGIVTDVVSGANHAVSKAKAHTLIVVTRCWFLPVKATTEHSWVPHSRTNILLPIFRGHLIKDIDSMLQLEWPWQTIVKIALCHTNMDVHILVILAWVNVNIHSITTWRNVEGRAAEGLTVIPSCHLVFHALDTPVVREDTASCTVHTAYTQNAL
jgi:hypothetical protein